MTTTLAFALEITAPIFAMLMIGALLKKIKLIDDAFVSTGSKLVFSVALPTFLFFNIATSAIDLRQSLTLVSFGIIATLLFYICLEVLVAGFVKSNNNRGVVVQASFRSNMGIIGLAYCVNAFGEDVYPHAAVYLALVTIVYNILSALTLTRWSANSSSAPWQNVAKGISKNPLIWSIALGLIVNLVQLPLPQLALQVGEYFSHLTLPLALTCIGASLTLKKFTQWPLLSLIAANKLLLIPGTVTITAVALGFRGVELGVIFLMTSAPTATVSYIMVKAIGGNDALAANSIVVTTILSIATTAVGLTLLRALQLL